MYAVKEDSLNSVDELRTFDALYLRPNDEGGRHFVYNINTMQRNLACRVIGVNKKPIPMTDLMIKVINSQASREPAGVEFTNINSNTTLDDYEARGNDSDSVLGMMTNHMRPVMSHHWSHMICHHTQNQNQNHYHELHNHLLEWCCYQYW